MKSLKKFEKLIKKYITGELSQNEKEILLNEAKSNKQVADMLNLHDLLTDP
jgi:hypothetical protein